VALYRILVPCYNKQNGYYSDDLSLEISIGEEKELIDIINATADLTT